MIELDKVQCAEFAACVNQNFEVVTDTSSLALELLGACPLGPRPGVAREPFTLTFRGSAELRLRQGIYKMRNAQLGEIEIFLVQIAADQTSSTFEAVFN